MLVFYWSGIMGVTGPKAFLGIGLVGTLVVLPQQWPFARVGCLVAPFLKTIYSFILEKRVRERGTECEYKGRG